MSIRARRELHHKQLDLALQELRRQHDLQRPVKLGDRWETAQSLRTLLLLARYQPTRWARMPAEGASELHGPESRFQAAAGAAMSLPPVQLERQPWTDAPRLALVDGGRAGSPPAPTTQGLPWEGVGEPMLAGKAPVLVARMVERGRSGHVTRSWSHQLRVDPSRVEPPAAITRAEGELRVARLAVDSGRLIVALRQPDGHLRIAALQQMAEATVSPPSTIDGPPGVGATLHWRPATSAVETLAAPDGMVQFPAAA
jgi:hypothetical protein